MTNAATVNKEKLRDDLKKEVGCLMPAYELIDAEVVKFNDRKRLGFAAVRSGEKGGPTIWVDDLLDTYEAGVTVREIAQRVATSFLNIPPELKRLGQNTNVTQSLDLSIEKIRNIVKLRILDPEKNREFLTDKPYRKLCGGLALVLAIEIANNAEVFGSAYVTNELICNEAYSADDLFDLAFENTTAHLAPIVARLFSMPNSPVIPNCLDDPDLFDADDGLFVLTNTEGMYGSAALFVPGVMEKIYDLMGKYYVLPSSIHEVLVLPVNRGDDPSALLDMVKCANVTQVSEDEVLADKVFIYNGTELKEVQNV